MHYLVMLAIKSSPIVILQCIISVIINNDTSTHHHHFIVTMFVHVNTKCITCVNPDIIFPLQPEENKDIINLSDFPITKLTN